MEGNLLKNNEPAEKRVNPKEAYLEKLKNAKRIAKEIEEMPAREKKKKQELSKKINELLKEWDEKEAGIKNIADSEWLTWNLFLQNKWASVKDLILQKGEYIPKYYVKDSLSWQKNQRNRETYLEKKGRKDRDPFGSPEEKFKGSDLNKELPEELEFKVFNCSEDLELDKKGNAIRSRDTKYLKVFYKGKELEAQTDFSNNNLPIWLAKFDECLVEGDWDDSISSTEMFLRKNIDFSRLKAIPRREPFFSKDELEKFDPKGKNWGYYGESSEGFLGSNFI